MFDGPFIFRTGIEPFPEKRLSKGNGDKPTSRFQAAAYLRRQRKSRRTLLGQTSTSYITTKTHIIIIIFNTVMDYHLTNKYLMTLGNESS